MPNALVVIPDDFPHFLGITGIMRRDLMVMQCDLMAMQCDLMLMPCALGIMRRALMPMRSALTHFRCAFAHFQGALIPMLSALAHFRCDFVYRPQPAIDGLPPSLHGTPVDWPEPGSGVQYETSLDERLGQRKPDRIDPSGADGHHIR